MQLDRLLDSILSRLHRLENPRLKPVRQSLVWNHSGALTDMTQESGPQFIFDDSSTLFQMNLGVRAVSDVPISATLLRRRGYDAPVAIASITLPAGDFYASESLSISASAGDRLSCYFDPGTGGSPAFEPVLTVRVV